MDIITEIVEQIRSFFNIDNKTVIERYNKISTDFVFNVIVEKSLSNNSYLTSINNVIKNIYDSNNTISDQAVNQFRCKMADSYTQFFEVTKTIFYKNNVESKIIGIDGSIFNKYLHDKVKLSSIFSTEYDTFHVTVIFDMINEMPLRIIISTTSNERKNLLDNMDIFNKGDVYVMDAGYPSKTFIKKLEELGIDYIIRLSVNLKVVKEMISKNIYEDHKKMLINGKMKKIRYVRYIIKDKNYFLVTSLTCPISLLEKYYHHRWYVEEGIEILKDVFNIDKTKTRKYELYVQEFYCNLSVYVLTKTFINISTRIFQHVKERNVVSSSFFIEPNTINNKVNLRYAIEHTAKYIIPALMYDMKDEFILRDKSGEIIKKLNNIPILPNIFIGPLLEGNLQNTVKIIKKVDKDSKFAKNKYSKYFSIEDPLYKEDFLSTYLSDFFTDLLNIFLKNYKIRFDRHFKRRNLISRSSKFK